LAGGRHKALPLCFDGHGTVCDFQLGVLTVDGPTMVIFDPPISGASSRSVSAAQLQRFAQRAQTLARIKGEVDILISNNKRLRDLNRRFRRTDKPTDVLSFPRPSGGDIAISAQIALDNAQRYGHNLATELEILVLHGMLHLAGYDHESDNGRMARAEARLRSQLKLPTSLIDRTKSSGKSPQAEPKSARSAKAAKNHHKLPALRTAKTPRWSAAATKTRSKR
jgi:probable rRNA maturation factor